MSSSADNQGSSGAGGQQHQGEVVYCHECQNEWYRSEHGLTCWRCGSDFTEILEDDKSDPREDVLADHRHDHDHDDDDELDDEHRNILMSMLGGMGGSLPGGIPGGGSPGSGGAGPHIMFRSVQTVNDGRGPPRTQMRTFTTGGSGGSGPAPGTASTGARNASPHNAGEGHGRPADAPAAEIYDMLSSIMSNIIGGEGGANRRNQPGASAGADSHQPHDNQGQGRSGPEPRVFGFSGSFGGSIGGTAGGQRNFYYNFGGGRNAADEARNQGGAQPHANQEEGGANAGPFPGFGGLGGAPGPGQRPGAAGGLDFAQFLAHIFGGGGAGPPFMFGVPHGASGDYAWSQADMDRILSQLMEQHQGNAAPPASEEAIKNLPKVKVDDALIAEKAECVVCRDEFKKDEEMVQLPCKHTYHEECVVTWLKEHDSCPICRTPVTPEGDREAQRQRHNEQRQQQLQEDASFLFPGFMRRGGPSNPSNPPNPPQ